MGRREQLKAELAAIELDERFRAMKADPKIPTGERGGKPPSPKYLQLKEQLREARRQFRLLREAAPPEESVGDAVARPATIEAKAGVKSPGGKG